MRCNAHAHMGGCHLEAGHTGDHQINAADHQRAYDEAEARFEQVADELVERQNTVHERVACPRCNAIVGQRCMRAGPYEPSGLSRPPLKHSHAERLHADGILFR